MLLLVSPVLVVSAEVVAVVVVVVVGVVVGVGLGLAGLLACSSLKLATLLTNCAGVGFKSLFDCCSIFWYRFARNRSK